MKTKKAVCIYVLLFFSFFLVYHILLSQFFPVDENNVLQAPQWYVPLGMAIAAVVSGIITFRIKRKSDEKETRKIQELKKKRDELVSQAEAIKYDMDNANKLLQDAKKHANEINTSTNVQVFSSAYRSMMQELCELEKISNNNTVSFTGNFQDEIEKIDGNMEATIHDFIDRSISSIPTSNIDWSEKVTKLIDEMKADIVFTSFWKESHEEKVSSLIQMCIKIGDAPGILARVDAMDGSAFEHWCASVLTKNHFENVKVTPASGDHGVDVLAVKDGIHYAIQCKCYSGDLGNTPIQEVYAGKEMYKCQVGVVMTNRYFTAGAKQLAEQTRVLLWDRDKLKELIDSAI